MKNLKKRVKEVIGYSNIYYLKYLLSRRKPQSLLRKRTMFFAKFLKPGDLFFDVGANLGNRIEPALSLGAKVVAIDPQKDCTQFLKRRFGNKIIVLNKGLGSKKGEKKLHISDAHTLATFSEEWIDSVRSSGRFEQYKWKEGNTIQMDTLDNLIAEFGLPKFIKIDVEGFEPEVLKGLTQPVPYLSFEYTIPEQKEQLLQCMNIINRIYEAPSFNYSHGESMQMALQDWTPYEKFLEAVLSGLHPASNFGDIYVKANV